MRKYTFELVIKEGNDEFWESAKGTGCDEVTSAIEELLKTYGWNDAELKLRKFEDE